MIKTAYGIKVGDTIEARCKFNNQYFENIKVTKLIKYYQDLNNKLDYQYAYRCGDIVFSENEILKVVKRGRR